MLYESVKRSIANGALMSRLEYHPFPKYSERNIWEGLNAEAAAYYSGMARGHTGMDLLPALKATRYMDFMRDGNRSRYQSIYFQRRLALINLTIAECIEGRETHLEEIIDIIWAICEETSWVVPAHNNNPGTPPRNLPDIEAPIFIDLFSAETGSALTWVYYFLGETIEKQAPLVKRRIEIEVKRRLLDPYLEDDSFGWKGLVHSGPVGNWNAWINSNILTAYLVMEKDEQRRKAGILHTAKSIQRFIDTYPADGGCDEGPGYFNAAGGSLFDYLDEIGYATRGDVNLYEQPLIGNIARYIYRAYIGRRYYVNFADAPPKGNVAASLLQRVGKSICDETLILFSQHMLASGKTHKPYIGDRSMLYRLLRDVFGYRPEEWEDPGMIAPRDHFFEGIQVMTAREKSNSENGFFVAFKGGHNAESHNHNDVGNFIIYFNGNPAIIDVGVEVYTRMTFGATRYTIWTMRSDYHNLPEINGCVQVPGREHAASDVEYRVFGNNTEMSLDIASAYPVEASVNKYKRMLVFNRDSHIIALRENYELQEARQPMVNYLMCLSEPELTEPGQINIGEIKLSYDAELFNVRYDTIDLTDKKIRNDWGQDVLYRIALTSKAIQMNGAHTLVFAER